MRPALVLFGGTAGFRPKRLIAATLLSMAIIVSLPFMAVASMGTSALSFLASAPDAKTAETLGFYMGGPVEGDTYEWGNCTYWAYAMRLWAGNPVGQYWGNANTWDDSATREGYVVDHIPSIGAVYQTDAGGLGHVAYVIGVDYFTGSWTISEMNFATLNVVSQRTFSKESAAYYTFIHEKKGAVWTPPLTTSTPLLSTGSH